MYISIVTVDVVRHIAIAEEEKGQSALAIEVVNVYFLKDKVERLGKSEV